MDVFDSLGTDASIPVSFVFNELPVHIKTTQNKIFPVTDTAIDRCGLFRSSLCHLQLIEINEIHEDACTFSWTEGQLPILTFANTPHKRTIKKIPYLGRDEVAITYPPEGSLIECQDKNNTYKL